jgi:hypothetical protein
MDLAPMKAASPTPSRVRLRERSCATSCARVEDAILPLHLTRRIAGSVCSRRRTLPANTYNPVHHTLVLLILPAYPRSHLPKPETLSGTSLPCSSSRVIVSPEHTLDPEVVLVRETPVGLGLPKHHHHPPLRIRPADMTTRRSHSQAPRAKGIPAAP